MAEAVKEPFWCGGLIWLFGDEKHDAIQHQIANIMKLYAGEPDTIEVKLPTKFTLMEHFNRAIKDYHGGACFIVNGIPVCPDGIVPGAGDIVQIILTPKREEDAG